MVAEVRLDPIRLCISDSIVDATDREEEAIGAPGCPVAHVVLTIALSTVIGAVQVREIALGENSIFDGRITVARRQHGCLRFSYVEPDSRTPPRFHCQPDLAAAACPEGSRVRPRFTSRRYGSPTYCQLRRDCPVEISQGADDESEMGAFHDLFQPQREANLRVRLEEFVPTGSDVGIILAS